MARNPGLQKPFTDTLAVWRVFRLAGRSCPGVIIEMLCSFDTRRPAPKQIAGTGFAFMRQVAHVAVTAVMIEKDLTAN